VVLDWRCNLCNMARARGDLEKDRVALEGALNEGRVTFVGERGVRTVSEAFVRGLGELAPCARRLAIARACVLPWRASPAEIPECYQWDLRRATADALEEYGSLHDLDQKIDVLLAADPPPISDRVLRQMASMSLVARYLTLMFAFWSIWWPKSPGAVWSGPDWLRREYEYAASVGSNEVRQN
jgi:hypothetical protein